MKIQIRDAEAVRAIRPMDAAFYLRANAWEQVSAVADRYVRYEKSIEGHSFEAEVAMNSGAQDYSLRMGELLKVLAVAEQRSQEQIYRDLLTTTSDVLRIRIADPELADGSLPIEQHAQLAQKARDLVLAAACAASEHRAVWHKKKPQKAMDHVRKVRIGQSERGSYILTVLSRVDPLLHQPDEQNLFEVQPPYEREVTLTLARSLAALKAAAEQGALTQNMSVFNDAVQEGVNANLCDAVTGLCGSEDIQRKLGFTFAWSPARPVGDAIPRHIEFSSDRIPIIREAARLMREQSPVPDYDLRGPVVKLERPDGSPVGKVTVLSHLEERDVRVTVELPDPFYHLAVTAHDNRRILRIAGTLMRDGRGFILLSPQEVSVVEDNVL